MTTYENLEARQATAVPHRDHQLAWERCVLSASLSPEARQKITDFCKRKHFSSEALWATGARVTLRGAGPDVLLAWPSYGRVGGRRTVTGVKYRHVDTGKRYAEPGSVWAEPIIVGDRYSMDWFVVEGETDTARIYDLVGSHAAILCMPAGALTVKDEWMNLIPGGATVYVALDADEPGDMGSLKVERALYQTTIRVRPPDPYKDWCEWPGDRDEFVAIVRKAKQANDANLMTADELLLQYADERSGARPAVRLGWGTIDMELKGISDGQVLGVAARTAVGKSWALGSVADYTAASGYGGIVMSLEMPGIDWIERQLAISEDVPPEMVESWLKTGVLAARSKAFREKFKNILFCDKVVSLDEMGTLIQQARKRIETDLRVVFVDYLGMVNSRGKDTYERTSAVGKGLKTLAKREKVAVVVAMQLSRQGGDGSRPVSIEMLRDSGVLEESLDFLLGCWRPDKDTSVPPVEAAQYKDIMTVQILKNRKGEEGRRVNLVFREKSRRLVEMAVPT